MYGHSYGIIDEYHCGTGLAVEYATKAGSQGKEQGSMYQVCVGNVGTVYTGTSWDTARETYSAYVGLSKGQYGRCAGEPVALLKDDEIHIEYNPPVDSE